MTLFNMLLTSTPLSGALFDAVSPSACELPYIVALPASVGAPALA